MCLRGLVCGRRDQGRGQGCGEGRHRGGTLVFTVSVQPGKAAEISLLFRFGGKKRGWRGAWGGAPGCSGSVPAWGGREGGGWTLALLSPLIAPLFAFGKLKHSLSPPCCSRGGDGARNNGRDMGTSAAPSGDTAGVGQPQTQPPGCCHCLGTVPGNAATTNKPQGCPQCAGHGGTGVPCCATTMHSWLIPHPAASSRTPLTLHPSPCLPCPISYW